MFLLVIVIIGVSIYNYIYKKHRVVKFEEPSFIVDSNEIFSEFSLNLEKANKKYLDKIIQINGKITTVNTFDIEIDQHIICYFLDSLENHISVNDNVEVKGRCIGFDQLLDEIKLDQCVLILK